MATTAQPKIEMEKVRFTDKQLRHVQKLRGDIDKLNFALQNYLAYLGEEYEIRLDGSWVLGDDGFERPIPPAPDGAPNGAPHPEDSRPLQEPPGE